MDKSRGAVSVLLALLYIHQTTAFPTVGYISISNLLTRDVITDPSDFSDIVQWAALGDSYAAGIGAGNIIDTTCKRYDGSYPAVMNADERFGDPPYLTFLACSGKTSPEVVSQQISKLAAGQQLITLSSGGNDVGLASVLDACVYNVHKTTIGCDATLDATEQIINNVLPGNLDQLLQAAKGKLASGGTIFQTGYAQFWGTGDGLCDSVTWAASFGFDGLLGDSGAFPIQGSPPKLTLARRQRMNDLVVKVNAAIQAAVLRTGNQVVFVDIDPIYTMLNGRYCEASVDESRSRGADRDNLLFFEVSTSDPDSNAKKRSEPGGFFKRNLEPLIQRSLDEQEHGLDDFALAEKRDNLTARSLSSKYYRTFHPRAVGHVMIANAVFDAMSIKRGAGLGSCAVATNPAPPRSPPPTCAGGSLQNIPGSLDTTSGGTINGNALFFEIRASICGGSCDIPAGMPQNAVIIWQSDNKDACEVSIGIKDSPYEMYMYRGTAPNGVEWQQCWDATEDILNTCNVFAGHTGWVNGPNAYQFYQTGWRNKDDLGAIHAARFALGDGVQAVDPNVTHSCHDCVGELAPGSWCACNCIPNTHC